MSKLSVRTGPSDLRLLPLLLSDVESVSRFNGVFALGVVGVLIPIDGVLDKETLRGEGVCAIRSFCVASLLAAGDMVLNLSMVDLGEGL